MGARVTNADLAAAVAAYVSALNAFRGDLGLAPIPVADVDVRAPYGQVLYLVRRDPGTGAWEHDLPGFEGSGGSGFVTKREAYEALSLATGTLRGARSLARRAAAAICEDLAVTTGEARELLPAMLESGRPFGECAAAARALAAMA
jgi:hypothetical protein